MANNVKDIQRSWIKECVHTRCFWFYSSQSEEDWMAMKWSTWTEEDGYPIQSF